jgi:hypothetical protein
MENYCVLVVGMFFPLRLVRILININIVQPCVTMTTEMDPRVEIASHFIVSSPPGQVNDVFNGN